MIPERCVWVFQGQDGKRPGGVFSARELAETWVSLNRLTGTLTAYPLDEGCFDWAMRHELVTGRAKERGDDAAFVASFTSAAQEHAHYVDGRMG